MHVLRNLLPLGLLIAFGAGLPVPSLAAATVPFREHFSRFWLDLPRGYRWSSRPPRSQSAEAKYEFTHTDLERGGPTLYLLFEPGVKDLEKCGIPFEDLARSTLKDLQPTETNATSQVNGLPAKLQLLGGVGEYKSASRDVQLEMAAILGSVVLADGALTFYSLYPIGQRPQWEAPLKESFRSIRPDRRSVAASDTTRDRRAEAEARRDQTRRFRTAIDLGRRAYKERRYDDAIEQAEVALDLKPNDRNARRLKTDAERRLARGGAARPTTKPEAEDNR